MQTPVYRFVGFGLLFWLLFTVASTGADDPTPAVRPSRNVIYITWDGFRWQKLFGGAEQMLISKDAGVADDDGIKSNSKIPNPHVNVLEFLNGRSGFENRVAAIATWDVFPSILNQPRSGIYVHAGITPIPGDRLTDRERLLNEMIDDTECSAARSPIRRQHHVEPNRRDTRATGRRRFLRGQPEVVEGAAN